jgi:hypothetical protein
MIPTETIPGMRRGRGMVEGMNSIIIFLIFCKNFCKCHNVPSHSTTIKKK